LQTSFLLHYFITGLQSNNIQ